jgi:hypothetical protein
MDQLDYKLTLNLSMYMGPPEHPRMCFLCDDFIKGVYYILSIEGEASKEVYFDEECLEQLFLITGKLFASTNDMGIN